MEEASVFRKYPSIESVYIDEFIEKIKERYSEEMYCVTEKIHGTNTQIDYNIATGEFTYGKRTDIIGDEEKCYNAQEILGNLQHAVKDLAKQLMYFIGEDIEVVRVYGELFGGSYPHVDVERDKKAVKVQKGVYYCPSNRWRAFDISYSRENDPRNYFLPGEQFFDYANNAGIPTVPLLTVVNSLEAALKFPNDSRSVVFQYYGLPEIENNIMEGVVIKPWYNDLWFGQHRVILKNKNEKFKERSKEKRVNVQEDVPEIVKQGIAEISELITENRVNNIISHLGQVTINDIGKVIGLTAMDVLEEYKKLYKTINLMEKKEEKMVTKFMQGQVAKLVKKVMTGQHE